MIGFRKKFALEFYYYVININIRNLIILHMKSDYLFLDVKESLIPNSGLGVFAKTDIKQGSFIVEYRGYSNIHINNE